MEKHRQDKHFIKKAFFKGGSKAMKEFVANNLKYPAEAQKNKIEGSVTMRLTINHKGKVTQVQIIQHLGYGCDEEAERVAKLMEFEVDPPRGLKITYHRKLTIHFKLPNRNPKPKTPVLQPVQNYSYTYSSDSTTQEDTKNQASVPKSYNYTINIKK